MPTFKEFFAQLGWPELIVTLVITGIIVFIREKNRIFGKRKETTADIRSME